jgi:preprotein translocase subunit YajC
MPESCFGAVAGGGGDAAAGGSTMMWLPMILLIVVFVVMIIVPNKRREKKFKDMMESLRVGDQIKTIGGFYGKIVSIKDDLVTFESGPDKTKLVISKSAIASVESFEDGAEINTK